MTVADAHHAAGPRSSIRLLLERVLRQPGARVGLGLFAIVGALALFGPVFAPYGESEIVGRPYLVPSDEHLFGTDALGRDVMTRILYGGDVLILLALGSILCGYAAGVPLGLAAGFRRGLLDSAIQRFCEVLISFPGTIFALLLIVGLGSGYWVLVFGVAATIMPRTAMITRAATLEIATRPFVERAIARGEPIRTILRREILPNVWTPIIADGCVRFAGAVTFVSSLNFLGFGLQPPAADWSVMVQENRTALFLQPWAILAPIIAIATLVISLSLIGDAFAKAAALIEGNE